MKATELRIGNILSFIGAGGYMECPVTGLTNNGKIWFVKNPKDEECAWNPNDINPIPITEKWLRKFGAEVGNANYVFHFDKFSLKEMVSENENIFAVIVDEEVRIAEIKYVHQLQNLYFALAGEELKLQA